MLEMSSSDGDFIHPGYCRILLKQEWRIEKSVLNSHTATRAKEQGHFIATG